MYLATVAVINIEVIKIRANNRHNNFVDFLIIILSP
jgi:hypothetical protein